MKKFVCILLSLMTIFCFCSCETLTNKTAELQDTVTIPKNGIIGADTFSQLKKQNGVVTFKGESNKTKYEWTVFGSDIKNPKDCNLSVDLEESNESLVLKFNSEDEFEFSPVISIYLNNIWNTQNATVSKNTNGNPSSLCKATVTGTDKSILNFSVKETTGSLIITPDKKEEDKTSSTSSRKISDGKSTEKDQYQTDPVPDGKPMPIEPDDKSVDKSKTLACSFSIDCSSILNNLKDLNKDKLDEVPSNGIILTKQTVTFNEGESVYDVLQRVCKENNIQMDASFTPIYNSAYVKGIHNLYEFDCGNLSGWMFSVNGWYPNYGCSRYQLEKDDVVEWHYTCDLGKDVGGGYAMGS